MWSEHTTMSAALDGKPGQCLHISSVRSQMKACLPAHSPVVAAVDALAVVCAHAGEVVCARAGALQSADLGHVGCKVQALQRPRSAQDQVTPIKVLSFSQ